MRKVVAQRIAEAEGNEFADDFRSKMSSIYGNYSEYAHPSDVSTAILTAKTGDEFNLRLGGEYDAALLVQSVDMFTHAGELLFTLLYVLKPNDAEYEERGGAIRERLAKWRKQTADLRMPDP